MYFHNITNMMFSHYQANIHSIMGSEDQVLNLMRLLDEGIQQAERIERKLDSYDFVLLVGRDSMSRSVLCYLWQRKGYIYPYSNCPQLVSYCFYQVTVQSLFFLCFM